MSFPDNGYSKPMVLVNPGRGEHRYRERRDDDGRSLVAEATGNEWIFRWQNEEEPESISQEKLSYLQEWIHTTQDPVPTFTEVDRMARALWGKSIRQHARFKVRSYLLSRTLNGPPLEEGKLQRPGYGLPITHKINDKLMHQVQRHPFLLGLGWRDWAAPTLTNREFFMLKAVEDFTNRLEWWNQVRDPAAVAAWREEVVALPWGGLRPFADFDEPMADACLAELVRKAKLYETTDLIPVMDYKGFALKSDRLLTPPLKTSLLAAVAKLEDVPPHRQSWDPSRLEKDGKVLRHLVDPSMWPLMYGLSKILPESPLTVANCLEKAASGQVLPVPTLYDLDGIDDGPQHFGSEEEDYTPSNGAVSTRFQWLPCDVDISGERPRIESYVNNLHPVHHADMYPVIEALVEKSLPAWDIVCRSTRDEFNVERVEKVANVRWRCGTPEICGERCVQRRNDEQWKATHELLQPRPLPQPVDVPVQLSDVREPGSYFEGASRIQVVVKMANIHLTPKHPRFTGDEWHVEGQFNEHVIAVAHYYYDSHNVGEARVAFRTQANGDKLRRSLHYQQGDSWGVEGIFAIKWHGSMMQDVGAVHLKEDRAVFFPNVYQHRLTPFGLVDPTRPGHRKVVCLYLVDPMVPVISTANVAPQQRGWWMERVRDMAPFNKLPSEILDLVERSVQDPVGEDKAKLVRRELVAERRDMSMEYQGPFDAQEWNFCE